MTLFVIPLYNLFSLVFSRLCKIPTETLVSPQFTLKCRTSPSGTCLAQEIRIHDDQLLRRDAEGAIMNNKQGFTLIELLVVIAIIGLLTAIAIPQFGKYRGQAYCSRAESDAANAALAMESYYALYLAYGTLAAANFTSSSPQVSVAVAGISPLSITATDLTGLCPKGTTYTYTQGGSPSWS